MNNSGLSERAFIAVCKYINKHAAFNRLIKNNEKDMMVVRDFLNSEGSSLEYRLSKIPGVGVITKEEILQWVSPSGLSISPKAGFCRKTKDYALVLALRLAGLTLAEVANLYGVTKERVRQIEAKGMRIAKNTLTWTAEERILKHLARKRLADSK